MTNTFRWSNNFKRQNEKNWKRVKHLTSPLNHTLKTKMMKLKVCLNTFSIDCWLLLELDCRTIPKQCIKSIIQMRDKKSKNYLQN